MIICSWHHRAVSFFASLLIIGCAASPRFAEKEPSRETSNKGNAGGKTENEAPAVNNGTRVLLTLEGVASYYAADFHGKLTSNGETFDMNALTAAHRTFPFGTRIRVTNLENSKMVLVRVNDRGPFKEGRIIDLSLGAAKSIDLVKTGTVRVKLEVLQWGDGK
ncbi:MAG: septal ring lytic transglycosylase RlpA family protein [Bacteroidota bacterium]